MIGKALILLVEDDHDIRASFSDALEDEGHAVIGAKDGLDALERLNMGLRPNLILLDLMMPRMDGPQFHAELSKVPEWSAIPIIIMTADGRARSRAAALGVKTYLAKPIMLPDLINTVHQALNSA